MNNDKGSIIMKKSNPIWIIIFIPLLIANAIYLGPLLFRLAFYGLPSGVGALGFIGVIYYQFLFSIIDFTAVFLYIIIQKPHGIAKVMSYTALIVISLALVSSSLGVFGDEVTDMKLYLINRGIYPAFLP
jgi:hypothetical protein